MLGRINTYDHYANAGEGNTEPKPRKGLGFFVRLPRIVSEFNCEVSHQAAAQSELSGSKTTTSPDFDSKEVIA